MLPEFKVSLSIYLSTLINNLCFFVGLSDNLSNNLIYYTGSLLCNTVYMHVTEIFAYTFSLMLFILDLNYKQSVYAGLGYCT